MKVLNTLKPGLDEKLYDNALVIELTQQEHRVEQQKVFPVHFEDRLIGTLVPNLIVDELVIVDPKVTGSFPDTHVAQMTGYLAITELQLALPLNLKLSRLAWNRVVRTDQSNPEKTSPPLRPIDVIPPKPIRAIRAIRGQKLRNLAPLPPQTPPFLA